MPSMVSTILSAMQFVDVALEDADSKLGAGQKSINEKDGNQSTVLIGLYSRRNDHTENQNTYNHRLIAL